MTPIINPLWFYLVDVLADADIVFFILAFFSGSIAVIVAIMLTVEGMSPKKDPNIFKILKTCVITCIASISLSILTPASGTCYKMMAASMITPDNITTVGATATEIVDYIVESVDTLLKENK